VVWTEEQQFGIRTQDPIAIDEIIGEPDGANNRRRRVRTEVQPDTAETTNRPAAIDKHGQSRLLARSMEFVWIAGAGAMLASSGFGLVRAALAKPISQVSAVLAPR